MSDDKSISLVNLGKLSKPADTLIKKVSDAVGGIFAPYQITRTAKAEAKASLIKAESDIQVTELHRRAMHRFVEEEAKRQHNIENITAKAIPQLDDNGDPSQIEDDWVTNFFDRCRIVSDDEMQNIWAKVLSGEANAPGTYSKRTVNFLSALDKSEAELFREHCGFGFEIGGAFTPLIYRDQGKLEIYHNKGINFDTLSHLHNIGLIEFNHVSGFVFRELPKKINISYFGQHLELTLKNESGNDFDIGTTYLTKIGAELVPICGNKPVDGFMEYVKARWKQYLPDS